MKLSVEEDLARLPLSALWEDWWKERPAATRDADGCEAVRAMAMCESHSNRYHIHGAREHPLQRLMESLFASPKEEALRQFHLVQSLIQWFVRLHPPVHGADLTVDAVEYTLASIPPEHMLAREQTDPAYHTHWREQGGLMAWSAATGKFRYLCPAQWNSDHLIRWWRLSLWLCEPYPGAPRQRPGLGITLEAHRLGAASLDDILDHLIGEPELSPYGGPQFADLRMLTGRKPSPLFETYPILSGLVERCRERILEVELARGEMPSAASQPAMSLRSVVGAHRAAQLLQRIGNEPFNRGANYSWLVTSQNRITVLSHLLRSAFPAAEDTPESFAAVMRDARIPAKRLIDLAVYAPQWAHFVEETLEWPQFEEAVWWVHAHTKDAQWNVEAEIREEWIAESNERTPLTGEDLLLGAVDVDWFHRVCSALGPVRWSQLDNAAKYASGGGGHKRAQLYADAMLGKVKMADLEQRVHDKRNQDALRAIGLVPLDNTDRERDMLDRYSLAQEFLRTGKKFGSQRQESEKQAVRICLENLARTAGFPDPARLEWAMERQAVADLAAGPVVVEAEGVTVTLSIDMLGKPEIAIAKGGKSLKSVPTALKKNEAILALQARKRDIDRQVSRMRKSLEEAMCRGDEFTGLELQGLLAHPVLCPMLRNLVFLGDDIAGYPEVGGKELEGPGGKRVAVRPEAKLRIAHPYDLLQTGVWPAWQHDCFLRERIQPFKQVFRELYVLTPAETKDQTRSERYAGHQLNPKQAMALFAVRGWLARPEEGIRRTFHSYGLTATVVFDQYFSTPAEVEGLTVNSVEFSKRGEWKPLPLTEIPPRVFSEAMRDMDLVVSVAHQGGVDPEASQSTVEMRATLVREACALLKFTNVRLEGAHALIDGHLGTYSVHLGSAVVHRQPGGHLCLVPVHSQHRGRLFLPFTDDDPKSAEVLSKVVMLSEDKKIKDPILLEQILQSR